VRVSFQPQAATAAALGSELPARPGDRLLVVRGDLADERLPAALRARGAIVDDIVGYRTVEAPAESGPLLREAVANGGLDAIVFTSGSTARGLLALADAAGITAWAIPAVCIGPETAAEAARLGFTVLAVAPDARADALATTTAAAVAGLRLET
jgi:uroporphyrinogen-III synthase